MNRRTKNSLLFLFVLSTTCCTELTKFRHHVDKSPKFFVVPFVVAGQTAKIDSSLNNQEENFGFVFTQQITVSEEGEYTFRTTFDGASKALVNDRPVANNLRLQGLSSFSDPILIVPGAFSLRIEFFQKNGGEVLDISYRTKNGMFTPIPADGALAPNLKVTGENCDNDFVVSWSDVNAELYRVLFWDKSGNAYAPITSSLSLSIAAPKRKLGGRLVVEAADVFGNSVFSAPINVEAIGQTAFPLNNKCLRPS